MLHRLSFILLSLRCNYALSNKKWWRATHLMGRTTIVAIALLLTDTFIESSEKSTFLWRNCRGLRYFTLMGSQAWWDNKILECGEDDKQQVELWDFESLVDCTVLSHADIPQYTGGECLVPGSVRKTLLASLWVWGSHSRQPITVVQTVTHYSTWLTSECVVMRKLTLACSFHAE